MSFRNLFGRNDDFDDDDSSPEDDILYFGAHHTLPATYGDILDQLPVRLTLIPLDLDGIMQPVTPGMLPLAYIPLPSPDAMKLTSPYPSVYDDWSDEDEEEPIRFPPGPRVQRQPSVATAAPAPAPSRTQPAAMPSPAAIPQVVPVERPAILEQFDPFFAYLVYLALGLGTMFLGDASIRFVLLAFTLIIFGIVLMLLDTRQQADRITTVNLATGFGFGFLIGVVFLIFVRDGLVATTQALYGDTTSAALLQLMAITIPIGETLFYRGALYRDRGFLTSMIAVGFGSIILYWPTAASTPIYLGIAALFFTILAALYNYIRTRYGLASAAVCQATVGILMLFVPSLFT